MLNNIHYLITLSFVILLIKLILKYKLFLSPIGITIYRLKIDDCHLCKMYNNEKDTFIIILRILIYKNYFCKIYK